MSTLPLHLRSHFRPTQKAFRQLLAVSLVIALWSSLESRPSLAQEQNPQPEAAFAIQGRVLDSAGHPINDAVVVIERKGAEALTTKPNSLGEFAIQDLSAGSYALHAERAGARGPSQTVIVPLAAKQRSVELVVEDNSKQTAQPSELSSLSTQPMEFADKPNFTVAGVTDWTAAGGHGSDTTLRTSEALVRETVALRPHDTRPSEAGVKQTASNASTSESNLLAAVARDPQAFEPNRQLGIFYLRAGRSREAIQHLQTAYTRHPADHENEYDLALALKDAGDPRQAQQHIQQLMASGQRAEGHSLAGELDEALGDPLQAVHEFEQAALLSPSEPNYFNWGSELLLHRAVWQAQEVFEKGAKAYPQSPRMLTALGSALFAGARYEDAARRLCEASDLNPLDPKTYEFMGKVEMAAPDPLPCISPKLASYLHQQPDSSLANYFYAMALWKESGKAVDASTLTQVEALLTKAVTLDPHCSDGYLQLGNLSSAKLDYGKAVPLYKKAIEVNPQLVEAYYRLGVAYDRTGERDLAQREFQLYDQIKKSQADQVEKQRRDVKQFVIVAPGQPGSAATP